jgi:hypothetical protein
MQKETDPEEAGLDPYVAQHRGLVEVHRGLCGALDAVSGERECSLAELVAGARAAAQFLLGHHHLESEHLFPALRRAGKLRSADVAFLDARDAEHRAVHGLCERLRECADAAAPSAKELRAVATEIDTLFRPHIVEEERGLAPERMRTMLDLAELEALGRELEALRMGAAR